MLMAISPDEGVKATKATVHANAVTIADNMNPKRTPAAKRSWPAESDWSGVSRVMLA